MKKLIFVISVAVFLSACSGGAGTNGTAGNGGTAAKPSTSGGTALAVSVAGKPVKLEPKAAYLFSEDWTINMPDGKAVKTAQRDLVIANYDLETTYGKSNTMKKMTAPEQVRIMISLIDKADVTKDTPISVGEYGMGRVDNFSMVLGTNFFTFGDGTDTKKNFGGSYGENKGSIKVTAVNGDTVSGEIDFTNTDYSIKGPFTAKIWKHKK